ncbi:hypothetical protein [Streptomyces sp. SAJ15]|uniref:hypothetical protein n=1 Tax=Streptomyces sp. SAJ15 TaxID=2011095 RepID=UPI0011861BCE|nr:hypothetical protein [Streptomyces sp. SAJ15]TVL87802.1 hypothetical protein CD790_33035 [Streptomyces sp. SAJ15]
MTEHAEPAGFTVVKSGSGWVALTGPGLTEGVDEAALTANALWEAVTGKPGEGWTESVRVIDRSEHAEAHRKAENDTYYGALRERAAKSKKESATPAQLKYLGQGRTRTVRRGVQQGRGAQASGRAAPPRRRRRPSGA